MIKWLVRNGFLPQDLVPEYSVHVPERKTEIHGLTVKDLSEEEKMKMLNIDERAIEERRKRDRIIARYKGGYNG